MLNLTCLVIEIFINSSRNCWSQPSLAMLHNNKEESKACLKTSGKLLCVCVCEISGTDNVANPSTNESDLMSLRDMSILIDGNKTHVNQQI